MGDYNIFLGNKAHRTKKIDQSSLWNFLQCRKIEDFQDFLSCRKIEDIQVFFKRSKNDEMFLNKMLVKQKLPILKEEKRISDWLSPKFQKVKLCS